jgi:hypothetical protein
VADPAQETNSTNWGLAHDPEKWDPFFGHSCAFEGQYKC